MRRDQLRHGLRALIGERREGASYDFTTRTHFGCGADLRRGIEFGGGVVPSSGKGARVQKNTLVTAVVCDQRGAVWSGLGVQPKSKVIFNKDAALATEAFPAHPIAVGQAGFFPFAPSILADAARDSSDALHNNSSSRFSTCTEERFLCRKLLAKNRRSHAENQ